MENEGTEDDQTATLDAIQSETLTPKQSDSEFVSSLGQDRLAELDGDGDPVCENIGVNVLTDQIEASDFHPEQGNYDLGTLPVNPTINPSDQNEHKSPQSESSQTKLEPSDLNASMEIEQLTDLEKNITENAVPSTPDASFPHVESISQSVLQPEHDELSDKPVIKRHDDNDQESSPLPIIQSPDDSVPENIKLDSTEAYVSMELEQLTEISTSSVVESTDAMRLSPSIETPQHTTEMTVDNVNATVIFPDNAMKPSHENEQLTGGNAFDGDEDGKSECENTEQNILNAHEACASLELEQLTEFENKPNVESMDITNFETEQSVELHGIVANENSNTTVKIGEPDVCLSNEHKYRMQAVASREEETEQIILTANELCESVDLQESTEYGDSPQSESIEAAYVSQAPTSEQSLQLTPAILRDPRTTVTEQSISNAPEACMSQELEQLPEVEDGPVAENIKPDSPTSKTIEDISVSTTPSMEQPLQPVSTTVQESLFEGRRLSIFNAPESSVTLELEQLTEFEKSENLEIIEPSSISHLDETSNTTENLEKDKSIATKLFSSPESAFSVENEQLTDTQMDRAPTSEGILNAVELCASMELEQLTNNVESPVENDIDSIIIHPVLMIKSEVRQPVLPEVEEKIASEQNTEIQESRALQDHELTNGFNAQENQSPDSPILERSPPSLKRRPITDITNIRSRTLDPREMAGWMETHRDSGKKTATLGRNSTRRRPRLQPKPSRDDDDLFPNAVTPSKVDPLIRTRSLSRGLPNGTYDVPYIDDDAFVPRRFRTNQDNDADESGSGYSTDEADLYWQISNKIPDHIDPAHLANLNECMPTPELIPKKGRGRRSRFKFCACVGRQTANS